MRKAYLFLLALILAVPLVAQVKTADHGWIDVSNGYTKTLVTIEMKHNPEAGSRQGLSQYDELVSQPTLADEDQERKETAEALSKLKAAVSEQKQKEVAQDLEIIIRNVELGFRQQDFQRAHEVPFINASELVFGGLRMLLDEQTPAERRPAAVARIRKYAGLEPGYTALTEILKQRVSEQMAKPGILYLSLIHI